MIKRKTIEVSENAHEWLMENRGAGSVKNLIDKIIAKYKEVEHRNGFKDAR